MDKIIEHAEFTPLDGARFLVHLLQHMTIIEGDIEFGDVIEISKTLGGLPLAINQMAAFINARNMSLEKFISQFDKYQSKMFGEKKLGWNCSGYSHTIDTVWHISFSNLSADSRVLLGILSYLLPVSIPLELFNGSKENLKRASLAFCADEY